MAKGNSQKKSNGSALDLEAQQAVPAPHYEKAEYNGARPEGLSDPNSEWFIKDEPQHAEAGENRDFYLSASTSFSIPQKAFTGELCCYETTG